MPDNNPTILLSSSSWLTTDRPLFRAGLAVVEKATGWELKAMDSSLGLSSLN